MANAQTERRRAAQAEEDLEAVGVQPGPLALARLRLHGVVDACLRAGVGPRQLVGIAGRVQAGSASTGERDVLAALDAADLETVGMTAAVFVMQAAGPMAAVLARMGASRVPPDAATLARAARAMQDTADALQGRLQDLPDRRALEAIGARMEAGQHDAADLSVVRALPAVYVRRQATARNFRLFADYRQWDDRPPAGSDHQTKTGEQPGEQIDRMEAETQQPCGF